MEKNLKMAFNDIKAFIYSYIYKRKYPKLPIYWELHETENESYMYIPIEGESIWHFYKMHKSKYQIEGELVYMPYILTNNTPTVVTGVLQKYNVPNANGRIYA